MSRPHLQDVFPGRLIADTVGAEPVHRARRPVRHCTVTGDYCPLYPLSGLGILQAQNLSTERDAPSDTAQ